MARINKVLKIMEKEQADCAVIRDVATIRYLTGFSGDSSLLYIDRSRGVLITDGRYTEQATAEVKMFRVLEYTGEIWPAAAGLIRGNGKIKTVGFDGACFSYLDYRRLHALLGDGFELRSLDFSAIRMIKDQRELECLLRAAQIADAAFDRVLQDIHPGCSECELAGRLEYYMRSLGSEKTSFDTIVASGARSALPHGMASGKSVEVGDFIIFDFGAVYKGYHSDMTRTVVLGLASPWQREIYTLVEEAQRRGVKAARPGITGSELDAAVRECIAARGYGANFVHGLGHGVGLEIHELPSINKNGAVKLAAGMVFTVEPGIYIPGKGGVRIEDTVVLTEEGAKALNGVRKQLIEIA